ncbi:hypothetical protein, partial [Paracoccus yeei]|uniref:hypothetical protein n=1 Tax=Paracoccus yeei TaxID=147645 RepID=UPI0028D8B1B6
RPHIPSDISQCQKAEETKQPKPRHFLRGAVQAIQSRIFPDPPKLPPRPVRPFQRSRRPVKRYLGRTDGTRKSEFSEN